MREYAAAWRAASTADAPTREAAEIRWRVHILPVLGEVPLGRLAARPSLIQSFVASLAQAGVAESYVRVILGSLSGALGAAVADQLIPRNPCASVRAPGPARARVIPWTAERVAAVRAGLPAHCARAR